MKKLVVLTLFSAMIVTSSLLISAASDLRLQGGAAATLVGAYSDDVKWVQAGVLMMQISVEASVIPGFQGAALLGFL